jgi:hypothetical protein
VVKDLLTFVVCEAPSLFLVSVNSSIDYDGAQTDARYDGADMTVMRHRALQVSAIHALANLLKAFSRSLSVPRA